MSIKEVYDFAFFRENYEKLIPFLNTGRFFSEVKQVNITSKENTILKNFLISYVIDIFNNIEKYSFFFFKESEKDSFEKIIYLHIYNILYKPEKSNVPLKTYKFIDYTKLIEKTIILNDLYKLLKKEEYDNLIKYFEFKYEDEEFGIIIRQYGLCYEGNKNKNEIEKYCKIYNFFVKNIKTLSDYTFIVWEYDDEDCASHILSKEVLDQIFESLKIAIIDNLNINVDLFRTFLNMDLNEENLEFLHNYVNILDNGVKIFLHQNEFTENEKNNSQILFKENLVKFTTYENELPEECSAYGYILERELGEYFFLNNEFFMKYIDPLQLNDKVKEYCSFKFNVFGFSKRKSLFLKYVYNELDSQECSEECELIKINEEGEKFNIKLKIKDEEYILPGDNQCLIHHGYITNINALCILDCGHILCSKCFDKNKGKCVYKVPHEFLM